MQLAYYSLVGADPMRATQLAQSLRSLRRYNRSLPIYLVLYGQAHPDVLREAARWSVHVQQAGDYVLRLAQAHPCGVLLADNPTLHKLLSLPCLPLAEATQILYLDCDTFFFSDVDALFTCHTHAHWFAREEPNSRRSPHGYDPAYLDEDALAQLANHTGSTSISPCNTGVCLLNFGMWWPLIERETAYLDLAWRLTLGIHLHTALTGRARTLLHAVDPAEHHRALPYPSSNPWILDEVAVWLTLGLIPGLQQGFFAKEDVMQGTEPIDAQTTRSGCVLAHYFSNSMSTFFAAIPKIARL